MMTKSPRISSRKRRIAAFILDHFILTFSIVSIIFLAIGPNFIDENNSNNLAPIMMAVMLPGFLLYFAKDSIKGISFGKWVMGIMVRYADDPHVTPSFGRLFIRNLLLVVWPLEFIVLASSKEKRRLGDKVANTIVIENDVKTARLPKVLAIVGFGALAFFFMFLFVGSTMKNSEAYKVAIQGIERNEAILNETGGIKGYGMMPTGNINVSNGSGSAQLQINVIGNLKDISVNVYLTMDQQGKWNLIEIGL